MIRLVQASKDYTAPSSSKNEDERIVHALRNVSLEIASGQFIAVMGPSGCGKSTLLHIAGGLDAPSSGEIWVADQPLHKMNERSLSLFRREKVGIIFQFFNLLPQLTALENVCLPLRLLGISPTESESRSMQLLDEVGLRSKSSHLPTELSGGEQQRVAIVRALVHHPQLVLADEPTGNLDSANSAMVLTILKDLHRVHQLTLLLVTHSQEVAVAASQIVHMQDGQIILMHLPS